MSNQNILHIASYEIKKMSRDWGFLLIAFVSMVTVTCLHLISQSNLYMPELVAVSLPSAIPFVNAYVAIHFLVLITVFWAGNWWFIGKTEETIQSIFVRPFSNRELLWGRLLGFFGVQLVLSIAWMMIALSVHFCFSPSPFAWFPYVFYFFTLTLPALFFLTGGVVLIKKLLPSRGFSFLVLLLVFCFLIMFGGGGYGIADLPGSYHPNMFSDMTGFPLLGIYLLQRGMLCLLGIGMLLFAVDTRSRIPNRDKSARRIMRFGGLFLFVGIMCVLCLVVFFTREKSTREEFREIFARYEGNPKMFVLRHEITFRQEKNTYTAFSRLILQNQQEEDLRKVVLYLNPGLQVISVVSGNDSLVFTRDRQVLLIDKPVASRDSLCLEIYYEGSIRPEVCYAEIEDLRSMDVYRQHYIFRQGRDFFYLKPDLTVLTPECIWYPVSVPPVNVLSPSLTLENYCHFELTVIGEQERTVISQGQMFVNGDTIRFRNRAALPGISLCMGPYTRVSEEVDGVLYELYLQKGHESIVDKFSDIRVLIDGWKSGLLFSRGAYRFFKLALVEAPLHFCAYGRPWRERSEFVQPEMIFRPEREATTFSLDVDAYAFSESTPPVLEWFEYYSQGTCGIERDRYVGNLFIDCLPGRHPMKKSIINEYNRKPLESPYQIHVTSCQFPGIYLWFSDMLKWMFSMQAIQNEGYGSTDVSAIDCFDGNDLFSLVARPDVKVLIAQRNQAFVARVLCEVQYRDWEAFTRAFLEDYNFQTFAYETYCSAFKERFGLDLLALTQEQYEEKTLPSFVFKDARIDELQEREGEKCYMQRVKVWNQGKVDGVLRICSGYSEDSYYLLKAGESVEIRRLVNNTYEPENWEIQIPLSQNVPSSLELSTVPVISVAEDRETGMFPVDSNEFKERQGEYVVDDTNSGFCLLPGKDRGRMPEITELMQQVSSLTGKQWRRFYGQYAFGNPVRSYFSKVCGTGSPAVEWSVDLDEGGMYEVFVYNLQIDPDKHESRWIEGRENPLYRKPRVPVQYYTVESQNGLETVELELNNVGRGWISLGKYPFAAGLARVSLSDKGAYLGQTLYADAVKWVKCRMVVGKKY